MDLVSGQYFEVVLSFLILVIGFIGLVYIVFGVVYDVFESWIQDIWFFSNEFGIFGYDDNFMVRNVVFFESFFYDLFRNVIGVYVGSVLGVDIVIISCFEEFNCGFFIKDVGCLIFVFYEYFIKDRDRDV